MKRAMVFLAAASLIAAFSFASGPQEKKAAERYAAFCGEYHFDLTSYGAGLITANVYIENDALYIWADKSEPPDVMKPDEDNQTKFSLDDPDEGHWDIEFLKDDQGKFTRCRLINADLDIDVIGEKSGDEGANRSRPPAPHRLI